MHIAALVALTVGVLCESICLVGMLFFRVAFDQLHYTSAATTVGLFAFAIAVILTGFSSASGTIECVTSLALLFMLNPVLTFATARAGRQARLRKAVTYRRRIPPTTMIAVQVMALTGVMVLGVAVVFSREPLRQAIVNGVFGLALVGLFVVLQAPDVALSELVVGTVAVPVVLLATIAKTRHKAPRK